MADEKSTSNAKVVIGCKLPHGLIIHVGDARHTLIGANTSDLINGFGITRDVPKDLWDEWLRLHPKYEPIKQGLIFVIAKGNEEKEVFAATADRKSAPTGLEPIDPEKPGNGVTMAEEQKSRMGA